MLIVCFVCCVFAGCGKDAKKTESGTDTNDIEPVSGDMFTKDKVDFLNADGSAVYNIVKPYPCTEAEGTAAATLFKQMKSVLGVSGKNNNDEEDGTDKYEILVGRTNRPESDKAFNYISTNGGMRKDDFVIGSIGKKIVIVGVTDDSITAATDYFINNFLKKEGIEGGIFHENYTDTANLPERKIGGIAVGHFKIVRPHYNSSYITQMEIEKLVAGVKDQLGYVLPIVEDAYEEPGKYEIIVGNTNRDGVKGISDRDAFEIRIEGTKVYLNGGHNYSTAAAVTEFTKLIIADDLNDGKSVTGSYSAVVASYDKSTYYTPTWYDDFDGTEVDSKLWYAVKPGENDSKGQNGKTSVRSVDPDITYVRDGFYQVHPTQNDTTYYGGMIRTNETMKYRYGYVEISEKIPNAPGFWTSLWAYGHDADMILEPEIDINESFGNGNVVAANCHTWPSTVGAKAGYQHTSLDGDKYGDKKRRYSLDNKSFNDDFHTFGFLWDETHMAFLCDGEIYFDYDTTTTPEDVECFNHSLSFMISMAVGFANNGEDINKATADDWQSDKCALIVDHFYVYQLQNGKQELTVFNK